MAAPQALIKDLEGEVNVTRNGEVVAVKAGDFLLPGDEVVTGGTGRLSLEFPGTEGQIPAAGVMTSNGKLTLGEQSGPNGQQIVVLEDGECFEFTTELAENSAAAEGGAVAGLFGAGLLGAGSGGIAGAGAAHQHAQVRQVGQALPDEQAQHRPLAAGRPVAQPGHRQQACEPPFVAPIPPWCRTRWRPRWPRRPGVSQTSPGASSSVAFRPFAALMLIRANP